MNKILYPIVLAFFLVLLSCGVSMDSISQTVKESMNESFATDAQFKPYHLTVTKVVVLNKGNPKLFQGIATVVHGGVPHDIWVDITVDGGHVAWETTQGSFLYLDY